MESIRREARQKRGFEMSKVNPQVFREYDVRGIAGEDLSRDFAFELGRAYSKVVSERITTPAGGRNRLTVAVGRDCRLTSDEYADGLIDGIRSSGINVINVGTVPTPLTYFTVFHHDLDGGVMITGSHNPSNYNGFKISVGRDTIHGEDIQLLRKKIEEQDYVADAAEGELHHEEIMEPYWDHIVSAAGSLRPLKVVLDAGNGTASTVAPELFERLGATVVPLYCELDGRFPNHHPDPTVPSNLNDMIELVRREGADVGFAFDGDSDRIGMCDEQGNILYGDEIMVLLARAVLEENPGATIISEVKSSYRLYDDIKARGGNGIMFKTGHSLIKSKMKETGAALAGEMSGHIFMADRFFGFDDAIYAAYRIYEIIANQDGPASALLADLPKTVNTPEIRLDCEEDKKFALVEAAKKLVPSDHSVNDIDGMRVDFSDGWGLLRASNTQPVLVMRFEAESEARLNEIRSMFEGWLKEAASALGHPPIVSS
jgi:phosphomannomutase/phosphoglucomutase